MTKPAERGVAVCVFVTHGRARDLALFFVAGEAVPAFGVGARADWPVFASGVEPVHLSLRFDGQRVFGAPARGVARLAGKPLADGWTELAHGSEVTFGEAAIFIVNAGERARDREGLAPCRPQARRIAPPFSSARIIEPLLAPLHDADGALAASEAATSVHAANEGRSFAGASPLPTQRVDAALARTLAQPVAPPLLALGASPAAPAPSVERAATTKPARGRAPLVRKALPALLALAMTLLAVRLLPARRSAASARVATAASSVALGSARPPARQAASAPASATSSSPAAVAELLPFKGGKTPERQAADLVARGAYADAAALYERLARHSDNPAFRAAARIARRKARAQ